MGRLPVLALVAVIAAFAAASTLHERSKPFEVACVIRNDGDKWFILDDAGHQPINCQDISLNARGNRASLVLSYGTEARYVHSLIVSADETFVGRYHAGASVGLAQSTIYFTDASGAPVSPQDIYDPRGNFFVLGLLSR